MKGTEIGLYCTVEEAGYVLGMCPQEVRDRMKAGILDIGEAVKNGRRTTFVIRKDLVAKEAGLDEFPTETITTPKVMRAERAGKILKQKGIDIKTVADALLDVKIITPYQHEKMTGVM